MEYNSDKEVVFAFMRRVNYNQTWEEIEFGNWLNQILRNCNKHNQDNNEH